MKKRKLSPTNIFKLVSAILLALAHIALGVVVAYSYQYYGIYPSLIGSVLGIVVCFLIIIDILFFVGFNQKINVLKIITTILAICIILGSSVGVYVLNSVNSTVNKVLNDGSDSYENVKGVIAYHQTEDEKTYTSIEDFASKNSGTLIVGYLNESSRGVGTIGKEQLDKANIKYDSCEYSTNVQLLFALADGQVDLAIFPNEYRSIFLADENNDYNSILNKVVDIYSFEEQVKIDSKVSKKDISTEPFNVLLIGWSRVELGSTVGLADAIILVSVNPQTYTASMMSIPRDSYVPITCYGNEYDKINSGRSTSRACFIETVEQFIGEDIDFYMELDYYAIVFAVNAIGGIKITNPVEFELDGQYMPAGTWNADGYQVLQFVRERHSMPNGDFDRQQHQKEVIMAIAKKLIESRDVNMALNALNAASDYMSTNLSLNQLTSIFNMILNTKNNTSLDTFDLLDFQTVGLSGYASWHYSDDYELPLWIYKLYDGSIKECLEHMNQILDGYTDFSDQKYSIEFSAQTPYSRPSFTSTEYSEAEVHEELPAFYPDFSSMEYDEVIAWAKENGVKLEIKNITPGDSKYDESLDGTVVDQSVRYGKRVSKNPTCTITVMGYANGVPSFVGKDYHEAKDWCEDNDVSFKKIYGEPYENEGDYEVIYKQEYDEEDNKLKVYIYGKPAKIKAEVDSSCSSMGSTEGSGTYSVSSEITIKATAKDGYKFVGWYNEKDEKVSKDVEYTFTVNGDTTLKAKFKEAFIITVEDSEGGTVEGAGSYLSGDEAKLKAIANDGYKFKEWSDKKTDNPRTFTVKKNETFKAIFVSVPKYTITLESEGNGSVSGGGEYYEGKEVTITAKPDDGYEFEKWDDGNTDVTRTITVSGNKTYKAKFKEKEYTISVNYEGDCGDVSGGTTGHIGDSTTISVNPPEGCKFIGWTDGDKNESRNITINGDASYTAIFELEESAVNSES